MGSTNRWLGFLASVASASLFYVAWFTVSLEFDGPRDVHNGAFDIGFAIVFWFFDGMAAALALMALPWYFVVRLSARLQHFNLLFFSLSGAVITLVIACATSSLSPKPLFMDDQSFVEGFIIAAERQGIILLLTGFVFGFTFWLVSERLRHSRSANVS